MIFEYMYILKHGEYLQINQGQYKDAILTFEYAYHMDSYEYSNDAQYSNPGESSKQYSYNLVCIRYTG